jgi:hypothetical protein
MSKPVSEIGREYFQRFGSENQLRVTHMSFAFDEKFGALMQKAIDRNSPLTRQEVQAVFGNEWEES